MKKLFRILTGLMSLTLLFSATACKKVEDDNYYKEEDEVTIETVPVTEVLDEHANEIYWLADYDINPTNNQDRSVALTLFEDQFHGKINWIQCTPETKLDTLTNRILGGDPVDMFPYEWDALPNGVYKNQYEPLDDYLDLNDPIWDSMRDTINMYAYNGQHYVIPYAVSDPLLLTYSRQMCEENGLADPYTLYQNGEWDWETFMEMMKQFVNNGDRYGICGWFGQAAVQSTGKTIINFDGGQFTNNITDPDIEAAENLLSEIQSLNLYQPGWFSTFPDTHDVLFYGMSDWALAGSNAANPDADLMIVPFPKSPSSDQYYLCGNYAAKMLVKNSTKGEAVARYIYCERLAETEEAYREAAKQKALIVEKSVTGTVLGYITEEQYDAIQSYKNDTVTVFDFGYGMGSTMYNSEYDYEARGVMNNLMDGLLNYSHEADVWAAMRDAYSPVIDSALETYNSAIQ